MPLQQGPQWLADHPPDARHRLPDDQHIVSIDRLRCCHGFLRARHRRGVRGWYGTHFVCVLAFSGGFMPIHRDERQWCFQPPFDYVHCASSDAGDSSDGRSRMDGHGSHAFVAIWEKVANDPQIYSQPGCWLRPAPVCFSECAFFRESEVIRSRPTSASSKPGLHLRTQTTHGKQRLIIRSESAVFGNVCMSDQF